MNRNHEWTQMYTFKLKRNMIAKFKPQAKKCIETFELQKD